MPTPHDDTPARFGADLAELDGTQVTLGILRKAIVKRFPGVPAGAGAILFDARAASARYHVTVSTSLEGMAEEVAGTQPSERLCRWLAANEMCLVVRDNPSVLSYLTDADRTLLTRCKAQIVVPLLSRWRLAGLVLLTSGSGGEAPSATPLDVLLAEGRVVGAALEGAHGREAEEEHLRAQHRAQQLAIAGRLAAEVAHEVKNPLAAIRLTIQSILESQFDSETSTRMLARTLGEVDRIQDILARLLNLARPEALRLDHVNLAAVAATAVDVVRSLAHRSGVILQVDLRQPLDVRADPAEMEKVFLNLLINACQAMPTGGTLTVISAIIAPPSADAILLGRVTIVDTGGGIGREGIERAFQPFFTTKKTGTGLGLPVSLDIVTRHGGRLELADGAATGTVATVMLPLVSEGNVPS